MLRTQKRAPILKQYSSARGRSKAGSRQCSASDGYPKVSIITVVRNGEATIARTLDSIRRQHYPNLEYIIVDGGSSDRTMEIVRENLDIVSRWISEPDKGIYDGFNKGLAIATGEYIGFVNSDDSYSPDQIEVAVRSLLDTGSLWVFGDTWLYGYYGEDVFLGGDPHYDQVIRLNMPSIQQITVLAHRKIFEMIGLFRTTYRVASDYDWFIRVALAGIKGTYNSGIVGRMWAGGVSTSRQKLSIKESFLCSVRNGHPLVEASLFWLTRYRFVEYGPPLEVKNKLDAARTRLHKIFGSHAGVPTYVAPYLPLWEDLAEAESGSKPTSDLLRAFASGRHAGNVLKESSLLYLVRLGSIFSTYAIAGESVGELQAHCVFESLSLGRVGATEAEILIITGSVYSKIPWLKLKANYVGIVGDEPCPSKPPSWAVLGALPGLLMLRKIEVRRAI